MQKQLSILNRPDHISQDYINAFVTKLLQLQQRYALREGPNFREMNPNQPMYIMVDGQEQPGYTPQDIMLASVSKVTINLALAHLLEAQGGLDKPVELDNAALAELFGRQPKRIAENQLFADIMRIPGVSDLVAKASRPGITTAEHKELRNQFAKLAPATFTVPLQELIYQALALSSNAATAIAKQLISAVGGDENTEIHKLTPHYSRNPGRGVLGHWLAEKPNVGDIAEHVRLIDQLGRKHQAGTLSAAEAAVVQELTNNPTDFKHDFTHTPEGQALIAKGYRILEKTGYYYVVFWIHDFVNPPYEYPPHMILATIVSIVPPAGSNESVVSFGHQQMYAVPLPMETSKITLENGEVVEVPDHLENYLKGITEPIKAEVSQIFRKQITDKASALLS